MSSSETPSYDLERHPPLISGNDHLSGALPPELLFRINDHLPKVRDGKVFGTSRLALARSSKSLQAVLADDLFNTISLGVWTNSSLLPFERDSVRHVKESFDEAYHNMYGSPGERAEQMSRVVHDATSSSNLLSMTLLDLHIMSPGPDRLSTITFSGPDSASPAHYRHEEYVRDPSMNSAEAIRALTDDSSVRHTFRGDFGIDVKSDITKHLGDPEANRRYHSATWYREPDLMDGTAENLARNDEFTQRQLDFLDKQSLFYPSTDKKSLPDLHELVLISYEPHKLVEGLRSYRFNGLSLTFRAFDHTRTQETFPQDADAIVELASVPGLERLTWGSKAVDLEGLRARGAAPSASEQAEFEPLA